ncbi:unnamed protein product [Effrenium voratum]|nr:unnamed protein product [Effrenium voratum]
MSDAFESLAATQLYLDDVDDRSTLAFATISYAEEDFPATQPYFEGAPPGDDPLENLRTDGWEVKGDDRQRGVELCEAMNRFEFKGRSSGRATLTEVLRNESAQSQQKVELQEQEVCSREPVSDHADDGQDTLAYNEDEAASAPSCHSKVDAAEHKLDAAGHSLMRLEEMVQAIQMVSSVAQAQQFKPVELQEQEVCSREPVSDHADDGQDTLAYNEDEAASAPTCHSKVDAAENKLNATGHYLMRLEEIVQAIQMVSSDTLAYNEDEAPSAPTCHSKVDAAEHKLGATGHVVMRLEEIVQLTQMLSSVAQAQQ